MHCFSFIVNSFQKMYLGACIYRLKKNWFIFKQFQIPRGHNKYTNFLRRKIIHCFSFMYMKSLSSKEDLLIIWCQLFIFVKLTCIFLNSCGSLEEVANRFEHSVQQSKHSQAFPFHV